MAHKTPFVLTKRQQFAFHELRAYYLQHRYDPTALELVDFVSGRYPERRVDINTVRPRLTEMAKANVVSKSGRRRCDVTGQTVTTWAIPSIAQCATEAA